MSSAGNVYSVPVAQDPLIGSARAVNAIRAKRAVIITACVLLALATVVACVLCSLATHHATGNVNAFLDLHPWLPQDPVYISEWKNYLSPQDWSKLSHLVRDETGFTVGANLTGIVGALALAAAGSFVAWAISEDKKLKKIVPEVPPPPVEGL